MKKMQQRCGSRFVNCRSGLIPSLKITQIYILFLELSTQKNYFGLYEGRFQPAHKRAFEARTFHIFPFWPDWIQIRIRWPKSGIRIYTLEKNIENKTLMESTEEKLRHVQCEIGKYISLEDFVIYCSPWQDPSRWGWSQTFPHLG